MLPNNKIGFWSVFAIAVGTQFGIGIFMLPTSLASYGIFSLIGWCISGVGAMSLCLIFSFFCSHFPETGGPHAYINHMFGKDVAFFVGWTYWLISWVSSTSVVVTAISSLHAIIGDQPQAVFLGLEILLLLMVTMINLFGIKSAVKFEFFLAVLKFVPLLTISFIALKFFNIDNIVVHDSFVNQPTSSILAQVTLLTMWGFIGLECGTTPAGSVENAAKTIPKAITLGTLFVMILYFINSLAVMGLLPGEKLMISASPYVDVAKVIFGGRWYILISVIVSIICVGSLNSWVLASSQVALGLAEDGLMPKILSQKNKHNSPKYAILASNLGIIPLLIFTTNEDLAKQIMTIIDFSVVAFIVIYISCCLGFLKLLIQKRIKSFFQFAVCLIATSFCLFILYNTSAIKLVAVAAFVLSGVPMYLFWYKRQARV